MICDHCGTVARSLTRWTDEQIEGCACPCHEINRSQYVEKKGRPIKKHKSTAGARTPLANTRKAPSSNAQ